jgi:hypothetical protein
MWEHSPAGASSHPVLTIITCGLLSVAFTALK